MGFLVFILASAAFLSAITAMRIAIHGRETTMPNLVGKNVAEASQALRAKGLILRVADRVYSDVPINQVVRQTPPPGMLMKVSQQAHVVLSLGQRELQIPNLEGNTLRVSRIELLRAGLQVGEVSTLCAAGPADGHRRACRIPKPGNGAATPRVDVLVSAGPRETSYVMPYFIGAERDRSAASAGRGPPAPQNELRRRAAVAAWHGDRPVASWWIAHPCERRSGIDHRQLKSALSVAPVPAPLSPRTRILSQECDRILRTFCRASFCCR